MLNPALPVDALAAAWRREASLRITDFLDAPAALALRDALRALPHLPLLAPSVELAFQYRAYVQVPDDDCDHVVCRFGRWLWSDGIAALSRITGLTLRPPEDRQLVATLYDKGSYLDPHNDYNGTRQVAFVLGLTDEEWPAAEGGWLTFPGEARPPGWNTLDLFDVRLPDRPHEVPILTRHAERRAISGWFY